MAEGDRKDYYPDTAPLGYSEEGDGGEMPDGTVPAHGGNWKARVFILFVVLAGLAALANYSSRWKKDVVVRDIVVEGVSSAVAKDFASVMKSYKGRGIEELDPAELKSQGYAFCLCQGCGDQQGAERNCPCKGYGACASRFDGDERRDYCR